MSRIAFIFRTDVHAADKGPASWKGNYNAEIFESLRQVGELARLHGVVGVLDGGDYFHVKAPGRNSHGLIYDTGKLHKDYPCPVYSIEGNHDLMGNNLDTIEDQPLGVLYVSGIFEHLREQVFESDGLRVRVVGVPYSPSRDLAEIQAIRKQPGDDYLVAIVHALAAENPPAHVEEFFGEPVFRYSSFIFEDGPDVFCFGHWHMDQGIVQLEGRHFVNQGALSRGALTKENTERTPKVSLLEFTKEGIQTRTLDIKVAPPEEVYDFDRKERQERESLVITQFVDQLEADMQIDPAQDVTTNVSSMNFAPEVRSRALTYLERARS
jgi:DNA repair exonuclease SbcCD nuclease subunit